MEAGLGSSSDKAASMCEAQEGQCRFGMRNVVCKFRLGECCCLGDVIVAIALETADAMGEDTIRGQTWNHKRLLVIITYRLGARRTF
jgi:hypothetical protein